MHRLSRLLAFTAFLPAAAPPPVHAQTALVEPVFLLDYKVTPGQRPPCDYRPTVNSTGTIVVFERTAYSGTSTTSGCAGGYGGSSYLYRADVRFKEAPVQIYDQPAARAEWCWPGATPKTGDGPLAFSSESGIFIVDPQDISTNISPITNTAGLIYPTWYPGCKSLAAYKVKGPQNGPVTVRVDLATGQGKRVLSGPNLWAGFADVNPLNGHFITFAGQPVTSGSYDQDMNYIYLADDSTNPPTVTPLDPNTPSSGPFNGRYQGRAPTFSPDGTYVAFESNRSCYDKALYSIFVQKVNGGMPQQVTRCQYNAQHARWFPPVPGSERRYLVIAANQRSANPPTFGIAALDVTAFVQN